jgi:hypothetical protein
MGEGEEWENSHGIVEAHILATCNFAVFLEDLQN